MRQASEAGIKFSVQNLRRSTGCRPEELAFLAGELNVSVFGGGGMGEPLVANVQYIACADGEAEIHDGARCCLFQSDKLVTQYMEEPDPGQASGDLETSGAKTFQR